MGQSVGHQQDISDTESPQSIEDVSKIIEEANLISQATLGSSRHVFSLKIKKKATYEKLKAIYDWRRAVCVTIEKYDDRKTGATATFASGMRVLSLQQFISLHRMLKELERGKDGVGGNKSAEDEVNLDLDSLDDSLCAICMERKYNIVLPCGHPLCDQCISEWRGRSNTCPFCRRDLGERDSMAEEWIIAEPVTTEELKNSIRRIL